MKGSIRIFAVATAVAAFALTGAVSQAGEGIGIGDNPPMADFEMMGIDGNKLSIAAAGGEKGTLVVFSCNACPWVKAWETRIADLGNTYQEKGIGVIQINSNDPAKNAEDGFDVMKARAAERDFQFPYVVDENSDLARAFGATRTPEAFLFDASGKLVYHGTIDDNAYEADKVEARYLRDALEAVATGSDVPVAETKALGCGIKFREQS